MSVSCHSKQHTLGPTRILKGRIASEKLVRQDAQCPEINFGVVRLAVNHLWWQVVERPAKSLPTIARRVLSVSPCLRDGL